jgi:hypothetical protein
MPDGGAPPLAASPPCDSEPTDTAPLRATTIDLHQGVVEVRAHTGVELLHRGADVVQINQQRVAPLLDLADGVVRLAQLGSLHEEIAAALGRGQALAKIAEAARAGVERQGVAVHRPLKRGANLRAHNDRALVNRGQHRGERAAHGTLKLSSAARAQTSSLRGLVTQGGALVLARRTSASAHVMGT